MELERVGMMKRRSAVAEEVIKTCVSSWKSRTKVVHKSLKKMILYYSKKKNGDKKYYGYIKRTNDNVLFS